ncbi:MAG: SET domain-containing protein-lysine N-methyltransferase [Geminicoccaceae bacterium]
MQRGVTTAAARPARARRFASACGTSLLAPAWLHTAATGAAIVGAERADTCGPAEPAMARCRRRLGQLQAPEGACRSDPTLLSRLPHARTRAPDLALQTAERSSRARNWRSKETMRSAALSTSPSPHPIRDFEYILRKLSKCLHIYAADTGKCGLGIFTAIPRKQGEPIIVDLDGDYYDQVLSYRDLTELGIDIEKTLQVGPDAYKLPTGSLEDLTNHSCNPNTGIRLTSRGTIVVALRDINALEELTYDYSTYLRNPYEKMQCMCGADNCRGLIGSFDSLPSDLKSRYLELDIVGDFVKDQS